MGDSYLIDGSEIVWEKKGGFMQKKKVSRETHFQNTAGKRVKWDPGCRIAGLGIQKRANAGFPEEGNSSRGLFHMKQSPG